MSANDNDNKSISDVQAENLAKNWSILSRPEQRQRLKELVAGERSMRGLAKRIGVSEATIRKRVDLAKLAPAEREAVESGKASVKGTLREIRRQRAARGPKIPTDQEGRTKFCKERVQLTLRWIAEAIPMDEKASAKLPEERHREAREGILRYRIEVLEKTRDQPFFELAAFGKPLQSRRARLPRAEEDKVIRRCRPKGEMGNTGPDHVNYWMKWFENWASKLIPNWTLTYRVLNRAIQFLEEEIHKPSVLASEPHTAQKKK